jgi:hypothetical protein
MTLNVLVQSNPEKGYTATVIGWPDFVVEGTTKEEALESVRAELARRLATSEIVTLEFEPTNHEHPWMKFAGMWKDDPTFDDFLAEIKAYREELDKEWGE